VPGHFPSGFADGSAGVLHSWHPTGRDHFGVDRHLLGPCCHNTAAPAWPPVAELTAEYADLSAVELVIILMIVILELCQRAMAAAQLQGLTEQAGGR
jgi:hypothetical protein